MSAGLDFESKIFVKEDAPKLLRQELTSKRWTPQVVCLSGITDPYQPVERRLRITRRCLEVLAEFRNPTAIITKNHLVARDIDVLGELARHHAALVTISVTTLDTEIHRTMEPRTSTPGARLRAIEKLAGAGIPVTVNVAPVIPGLTDHEIPALVSAAADAGATAANYILLRLPHAVKDLFDEWLTAHFPDRREKVLARIRDTRGGELNRSGFGQRMRGAGPVADNIQRLFEIARRRAGLTERSLDLSTAAFRRGGPSQLSLFDEP
jgi:DNA repair photolyase